MYTEDKQGPLVIHDYTHDDVRNNERAELEARFGKVWDTEQLRAEFEVHSFCAPNVVVTRKEDGARGWLEFTHNPRYYFNFEEVR